MKNNLPPPALMLTPRRKRELIDNFKLKHSKKYAGEFEIIKDVYGYYQVKGYNDQTEMIPYARCKKIFETIIIEKWLNEKLLSKAK